jgi:hypothetical protein
MIVPEKTSTIASIGEKNFRLNLLNKRVAPEIN